LAKADCHLELLLDGSNTFVNPIRRAGLVLGAGKAPRHSGSCLKPAALAFLIREMGICSGLDPDMPAYDSIASAAAFYRWSRYRHPLRVSRCGPQRRTARDNPPGHLAQVASSVCRLDRSRFSAAGQFDGRDAAERGIAKESFLRTPVEPRCVPPKGGATRIRIRAAQPPSPPLRRVRRFSRARTALME
jgi:hypothetical protein